VTNHKLVEVRYVDIARQALKDGNMQAFKLCVVNRQRVLKKEMAQSDAPSRR
jgi:hypothetical protein